MAEVSRISVLWTGFPGSPGYSKFSFMPLADDTARNAAGSALRTFFVAVAAYLPNGTTISIQPMVDNLDTVTGDLIGSLPMSSVPSPVVSTVAAAAYVGGSGFVVTWAAAGVFNGRRIRGRTFVVPAVGCFESDGTITAICRSNVEGAGTALIAGAGQDLAVWNRQYTKTTPPVPIAGDVRIASSATVKDMAAQLRSRRT